LQKVKGWLNQLQPEAVALPEDEKNAAKRAAETEDAAAAAAAAARMKATAEENSAMWGYGSGPLGPQHWGELSNSFELCSIGQVTMMIMTTMICLRVRIRFSSVG
jgi:hypothetical protein